LDITGKLKKVKICALFLQENGSKIAVQQTKTNTNNGLCRSSLEGGQDIFSFYGKDKGKKPAFWGQKHLKNTPPDCFSLRQPPS